MRAEVENNLILGIAAALARNPRSAKSRPYFATVELKGRVTACALRTPPHKFVLSGCDNPNAMRMLAADAASFYPDLEVVLGPEPDVEAFAGAWSAVVGRKVERGMRQRIHEIRLLERPASPAPGRLRPARDSDLDVVIPWIRGLVDEIQDIQTDDPAQLAQTRLNDETLFLWDDRGPVSMAGWGGKTPNGVRVNLVYTPRELRSRGYATACVSALTERLLSQGNKYCCLYTNLANPVSNRIYHRIGYRPVRDFSDFRQLQS